VKIMSRKILIEKRLKEIFQNKQVSEDAIEWIDEHISELLTNAYTSIKDNGKIKRITKEIAKFIIIEQERK